MTIQSTRAHAYGDNAGWSFAPCAPTPPLRWTTRRGLRPPARRQDQLVVQEKLAAWDRWWRVWPTKWWATVHGHNYATRPSSLN